MAVELATAYVSLVPSAKGMKAAIEKEMGGPLADAAKTKGAQTGNAFTKGLKSAAIGAGVALLARGAFNEAQEAQKVAGQTNAVIKSTGAAAGISAKHVDDLANSISKAAGIDDELVASTENMLLTFTGIKAGGQVFDRATQAAVDLAAAMGTDAVSSAQLLGKALNDPAKGLTRLTRSGVVFTDQQKDQIKVLQASGQTAKAQGIILAEVEKEFGGSAAAQATAADKARVSFQNFEESLGTAAAPAIDTASKALGGLASAFSALPQGAQQAGIVAAAGGAAWLKWGDSIKAVGPKILDVGRYLQGLGTTATLSAAAVAAGAELVYQKWTEAHTVGDNIDSLGVALDHLYKTQKVGGELAAAYGSDLSGLKSVFDDLNVSRAEAAQLWAGSLVGARQTSEIEAAKRSLDNLDKSLASKNPAEAKVEFELISSILHAQGVPLSAIKAGFDDYGRAARDAGIKAKDGADKGGHAVDNEKERVEGLIGAYVTLRAKTQKAHDVALDKAQALTELPGAQLDISSARDDLAKALKAGDAQGAASARSSLLDATVRYTELERKAKGWVEKTNDTYDKQVGAFEAVAATLAPGDPLRVNLEGLITTYKNLGTAARNASKEMQFKALDPSLLPWLQANPSGRYGSPAPSPAVHVDSTGATVGSGYYQPRPVGVVGVGGSGHGMMPRSLTIHNNFKTDADPNVINREMGRQLHRTGGR